MFIDLGDTLVNLNNVTTISRDCYSGSSSAITFHTIDGCACSAWYSAKAFMDKDWNWLKNILEKRCIECVPFGSGKAGE